MGEEEEERYFAIIIIDEREREREKGRDESIHHTPSAVGGCRLREKVVVSLSTHRD